MNHSQDDQRMFMAVVGGALLIVLVMIASIFIVTRRPIVVVVPAPGEGGAPGAPAISAAPPATAAPVVEAPPPEIQVSKVEAAPEAEDPLDAFWQKIAVTELELVPQQVAPPMLQVGSVAAVRVQAVRDNQRYIWRLSWDQPQPSSSSEVGEFSDAVAMQFPMSDGAPYTMGGPGMPVRMLYWKAIWQKDVDEGFQGLLSKHPNTDADFYWFAEGKKPFTVDQSFDNPAAKQWFIANAAGNPMANFSRKQPIEELTAVGFGSSTHLSVTPSRARGVWSDGQWHVVIDRPVQTADPLIARFQENPEQQLVAFAVWDGHAGNRGASKHITNWIPMRIVP